MKTFYRLLNYEFGSLLGGVAALFFGTAIIPLWLLSLHLKDYSSIYDRYERIYAASGSIFFFIVSLVLLLALFVWSIYSGYWRSKSIYTMLTLPVRKEIWYFAKLGAFFICLLLIWLALTLNIWMGHGIVSGKIASATSGQAVMNNGLFLAMLRSDFMNVVLPLSFRGALSTISMMIALVTGVVYGTLCERSRRYWGFLPLIVSWVVMYRVVVYRMELPRHYPSEHDLYGSSALLLVLSAWYAWHSIRLLRKGAIA